MCEIVPCASGIGGLLFDMGGANLEEAALRKRRSPRQTLEDHAPQGVNIARGGRRLTFHQLGRHVIESPKGLARSGQGSVGAPFGESEISKQGIAGHVDQDVRGLDITMHEAGIVEGVETRTETGGKVHDVGESLGAVGACDIRQ